jgi:Skp family chaperone for outer membrane proteins
MKNLALLAIAAAVIGGFAAVPAESQGTQPYQPGFLDVRRVMQDYKKREAVEKDLKGKADQVEKQIRDARLAIEAKGDKLQTLNPESEEAVLLDREISMAAQALKSEGDWQGRRLEREKNFRYAQIYNEVAYEVRLQAESRGLAMVIVNDPLPAGWEKTSDFMAVLRGRAVLYADSRLDLTQGVIDALNAKLPK